MSEEAKICPYTGLRPFSEEESLYFKGRDEHIEQATKQLGKNKFLILTGASGDGKSSLVYAGIVPNARAGFLKSSFSNWAVADFKPERSPFLNLCKSIARQLNIPQLETVKAELSHGFSALVDLYKASSLYYDEHDRAWLESDENGKTILKRKAANLLILADQFEEFFTNPENYHRGVPSGEASLVTNLLLETAQLALEENLPIYVVITMRSDFIGQCAAFRGLPEYIGFSQFFVPRLNRKQLQEVIEEPARLNGDSISRRLTERLIHDMVEGTDQLPILQHALNQIWKMAGDGEEEMDLIHYAMVGGMDGNSLPDGDIGKFKQWFSGLPEKIQECYDRPDLQNVLNTHANKLFNQAGDAAREVSGLSLSDEDSKLILETTFRCLTKIDNGRAVRNRMSLGEITQILDKPHLNDRAVGNVVNIFRESGNTLLKPYMDDSPESRDLKGETVLDITHESLIRNWEHLGEWASEEFANYSTFLDFEQQLNRWVGSGKSNSFLLYIGPLTYFESWFERTKPSAAWIARYLKDEEAGDKHERSRRILSDAHEFLHRSARKHWVTRTVMRYGPRRIAAVIGIIGLLVLSSFTIIKYLERRDEYVLSEIREKVLQFSANPKISLQNRVAPLLDEMRLHNLTLPEIARKDGDPLEKINLIIGIASKLTFHVMGADVPSPEIDESFALADSLLNLFQSPPPPLEQLTRLLVALNNQAAALELRYYYDRNPRTLDLLLRNARRLGAMALYILKTQPAGFASTIELNSAIEHALNHQILTEKDVHELLAILSPFERSRSNTWLDKTYEKSKIEPRGEFPVYGAKFNGLYQELAYLYATLGDRSSVLKCIDTLLFYNQNYHSNDYNNIVDNATNIAVSFYRGNHPEEIGPFVRDYCRKKETPEVRFLERIIMRGKLAATSCFTLEIDFRFSNVFHNTNIEFGNDDQIKFFFDLYRDVIARSMESADAKNLRLAESYKNEMLVYAKRLRDCGKQPDSLKLRTGFDRAFEYFHKVSLSYRSEIVGSFGGSFPREDLFIFPDAASFFHPWEPRGTFEFYSTEVFVDYLLKTGHFEEVSKGPAELRIFEGWLVEYNKAYGLPPLGLNRADRKVLLRLAKKLNEKSSIAKLDLNSLYWSIGNEEMEEGKKEEALAAYSQIEPKYIHNFLQAAFNPHAPFGQVADAIAYLYLLGKSEAAHDLILSFPSAANRASIYGHAATIAGFRMGGKTLINQLMDSCRMELEKDDKQFPVPRIQLAGALAARGDDKDLEEATRVIKNIGAKGPGFRRICRSLAFRGRLYEAWNTIPDVSDASRVDYLNEILYGLWLTRNDDNPMWKKFEQNRFRFGFETMFYDGN